MVDQDDTQDPFQLASEPHRTKGRGLRISISERLRVARKIPQAVVKVTSFCHGPRHATRHLDYITRQGDLPLEKDSGEVLLDREEQQAVLADWVFDSRKRSRDTANIVFSMPPGADLEALRRSVRKVGLRAFEGHEWVFAVHNDRHHPHAHMMVAMRGWDSDKKMRLRKADLFELRKVFAEAAREEGVQLAATPRYVRGVGRRALRQDLYFMKKRGVELHVERDAAREAIQAVKSKSEDSKPWEDAMNARHEAEKKLNLEYAQRLRLTAEQKSEDERKALLRAAESLERLAHTLPTPKTRRQAWMEHASKKLDSQKEKPAQKQGQEREV